MLTSTEANRLLSLYEAMLGVARDNDWDRLAELQQQAADLRDQSQARAPLELTHADQEAVTATLQRILELDREIRTHAEPALESTRKLLSGSVLDRNVRNAYGKFGG
ncbi:flagellar protein FliT [Pseudothauera nasutitermitis]|uniref:Flagellar protein FliT n=1 Tax=Pseudothauera nasutitermitis TaxID=2565930 RepID=A0A4S4B459_9RHOO|nr:flagellar protein FliT [Pseudothauera nasutitermitis]THF65704.1 flagellar protein FliT [Pseudothauera nasutitermitis]